MIKISFIIVSYNTKSLTEECILSIIKFLDNKLSYEIIVIDNCSSDGSAETLQSLAKNNSLLKIQLAPANLGFSKANNIGISSASGQYILLLNSDTYLIDDSIIKAITFLDQYPKTFGCGCCLLDSNLNPGVSFGQFPSFLTVLQEIVTNRFSQLRGQIPKPNSKEIFNIDFPCGAFFLINRNHLNKIGLLDESFFMYFEETDLALRAKRAGLKIKLLKNVKVVHLGGGSSKSDESAIMQLTIFYKSWKQYTLKNHGSITEFLLKITLNLFFEMRSNIRFFSSWKHFALQKSAFQKGWVN